MPYFDPSREGEAFARIGMRLAADVRATMPRLAKLGEDPASQPRAPGKWSPKEILGHLIDSASNNHQRLVRAQLVSELRGPGYDQAGWVASQQYAQLAWSDLIELWSAYNRHLAHVIAVIPEERGETPCYIGDDPPVTLRYVALDYVGHIHHHLRQIFP
jgi:hypothetical protein